MQFVMQTVGNMSVNTYILFESGSNEAIVIDPGAEPEAILLLLRGKKLKGILLTHGHADHIGAVEALRNEDAPVYIHKKDARMLTNPNLSLAKMVGIKENQGEPDYCLEEGEMSLAGLTINVLHTPGHTPGSVCFLIDNILFSGDTLFERGVGRTDLPGGDEKAMTASIAKLMQLDKETEVYPGHGSATTIRSERRFFP